MRLDHKNKVIIAEDNHSLIYGRNPVLELIKNTKVQINKIWISNGFNDKEAKQKIIFYAKGNKIPFHFVPNEKLNTITKNKNHQGIAVTIAPVKYLKIKELLKDQKIILVAHEIEDPHNLGAVIRTFVAGGGNGIILTGRSNIGLSSTCVRTSAGAIFQANFARVTNCVNVLDELKNNGFWVIGTANSDEAKSVYELDLPDQVAILIGGEHAGLGQLIKKNCDFLAKIPINPNVDSLNVSVAFGIVLFEILRKLSA